MFSLFIDRPVFAWVIAIVIMLAGTLDSESPGESVSDDRAPAGSRSRRPIWASAQMIEKHRHR